MELLFLICHGNKNSRFLVQKEGDYKSVLISNNNNPFVGMDIDEKNLNIESVNEKWIERYEKYNKSNKKIKSHMIKYKKQNPKMNNLEWGYWAGKQYEHILPEKFRILNLIDGPFFNMSEERYQELVSRKEIHKGFGNLNSSQAFAINLFVPMIQNKYLYKSFVKEQNLGEIKHEEFEQVLIKDEGTQLDFYLETEQKKFTFEIKYSENAFGDTEKDESHEIKYNEIYKNRLLKCIDNLSEDEFFEEYQLWRNICFAAEGYEVRFVFPAFREDLADKVVKAKERCKNEIKDKIDFIYVDEFIKKMKESDDDSLRKHYLEFENKYLNL